MEAARVLALRGHTVTLAEKEKQLGGMYRWASVPEFKDDGKLLISWYEHQMERLKVQVELKLRQRQIYVIKPSVEKGHCHR